MRHLLQIGWLILWIMLGPLAVQAQYKRVAAGDDYTVVIKDDGSLWAWGSNGAGQLGDGTTTQRVLPQRIGTANDWLSVSCGGYTTLAIRRGGTLWAWGHRYSRVPTQIDPDTTWVGASAGSIHAVALRRNGTLWTWGQNFSGQLGNGTYAQAGWPTQVGTDTDWVQAVAGGTHTLARRRNGTLWAWGENYSGQCGVTAGTSGVSTMVPVQVGTDSDWFAISAGAFHSLGIRQNGSLWAWGKDDFGQCLGTGNLVEHRTPVRVGTASNWVSVTAGSYHSLGLRADGTLWAWGDDNAGELGVGRLAAAPQQQVATATNWSQVSAASGHTVALRTDGTIWSWGYNPGGEIGTTTLTLNTVSEPLRVGSLTTWVRIAAGMRHTAAIRADSTLWLWGANDRGQLGEALTTANYYRYAPAQLAMGQKWTYVACGASSTFAVRADGTLWAWGENPRSQLGLGPQAASTSSFFQPQQIGTAGNWASVAVGSGHTLALRTDGTLWAWGYNNSGQVGNGIYGTLGNDVQQPIQIGTATTWRQVAACNTSSLALRADGTIWSWGENSVGQLGDGTTNARNLPAQVGAASWASLATGGDHVLALRPNGTLWAWGYNAGAQLGDGTTSNRLSPTQIGTATTWNKVAGGIAHSIALRTDGTIWQWGAYTYYLDRNNLPALISRPVQVPGPAANWASLTAGHAHSVALQSDGSLWAWGTNGASQLGNPIFTDVPVLIALVAGPLATQAHTAEHQSLAVFPNPAHHSATLAGAKGTAPIMVQDMLGREIKRQPAGTSHLSLEGMAPGAYLVRQGYQVTRLVVE